MAAERASTAGRLVRVTATLLMAVVGGAPPAEPAVRNEKTLFQSQPLEWDPQFRPEGKVPPIVFTQAWVYAGFKAPLAGEPVPCGDLLVAASQDGLVVALDPTSGAVAWTAHLPASLEVGPSAATGAVYQATGDGHVFALDGHDGRIVWAIDVGSPAAFPVRASGGRLLVATMRETLLAIDARDGNILIRRPLPGRPTTPPEQAPGVILIGTEHGMLLALDEVRLETIWRRYFRHSITAPPLFRKNRVYVAVGDRSLRCLRFKTGRPLWSFRTGAMITALPFSVGPWLYFLCYDDDIYVLRARNGHLMTRVRMGHRLDVGPARTDEHLFVVPFKEASVVGLTLPGLQHAGKYQLDIPGESFTTAPVMVAGRVAIGYGWNEGRVMALQVDKKEQGSQHPPVPGAAVGGSSAGGATDDATGSTPGRRP